VFGRKDTGEEEDEGERERERARERERERARQRSGRSGSVTDAKEEWEHFVRRAASLSWSWTFTKDSFMFMTGAMSVRCTPLPIKC